MEGLINDPKHVLRLWGKAAPAADRADALRDRDRHLSRIAGARRTAAESDALVADARRYFGRMSSDQIDRHIADNVTADVAERVAADVLPALTPAQVAHTLPPVRLADAGAKPDLAERERAMFDELNGTVEGVAMPVAEAPVKFALPYPPSLNHLYATVRGRRVLSAAGRRYKELAATLATAAGVRPHPGPVRLTVKVYRPRKCGDLDNTLKVVLDSITGIGWEDDRQVEHIHAHRFDDKGNPRVDVEIVYLPGEDDETT